MKKTIPPQRTSGTEISGMEWPRPGRMFIPVNLDFLRSFGVSISHLPDTLQSLTRQGFFRSDQLINTEALSHPEQSLFPGAFHDLCLLRGISEQQWRQAIVPVLRKVIEGYADKKPRRSGEAYALHPIMVAMAALLYAPPSLCPTGDDLLLLVRCCLMHDYVEDVIFKQTGLPTVGVDDGPPKKSKVAAVFLAKFIEAQDRLQKTPDITIGPREARIIMALTVDGSLLIDGAKLSNHFDQIKQLGSGQDREIAAFARCLDKAVNLIGGEGDRGASVVDNARRWNKQLGETIEYTLPIYDQMLTGADERKVIGYLLDHAIDYATAGIRGILETHGNSREAWDVLDDLGFNEERLRGTALRYLHIPGYDEGAFGAMLARIRTGIIDTFGKDWPSTPPSPPPPPTS